MEIHDKVALRELNNLIRLVEDINVTYALPRKLEPRAPCFLIAMEEKKFKTPN